MKPDKRIARIIKTLLYIGIVLMLLQGLLVYIDITFTSDKVRRVLVKQLTIFTQREVHIDGDVNITVSLLPQLLVERIYIKNVEGFGNEDFVTVSEARIQVSLLPLLSGKLHLNEFSADHVHIGLIQNKDGSNNWSYDHLIQTKEETSKKDVDTIKKESGRHRLSLGVLRLTNITFTYKDLSHKQIIESHLGRLLIDLEDRTKPQAEITGTVQDISYYITFESEAIDKLASGLSWELQGAGRIAERKTKIDAVIQLSKRAVEGKVDINVQDINLGLMLEQLGIISGEDAVSKELNIKARLHGEDITGIFKQSEIDVVLGKGYWKWQSSRADENKELKFNQVSLRSSWNKPVELHLDGLISGEALRLDLKSNRLKEFFDDVDKLDVDLKAYIAGSDLALKGILDLPIKTKQFQLDISLKGKDLEKLNKILSSELPPFNNFSLTGKISANEKGFIIKAEDATIGNTHFKTAIVIDTSSFKAFWTINLNSRQLQIKDFEFTELNVENLSAEYIKAAMKKESGETKEEPGRRLIEIVDNPKIHFDLNLKVDKVFAGDSALGSSSFMLKLRDDALILQDAELNMPGGKIKTTASFKVENEQVTGTFMLDMDKLETGVVVRYFTQDKKLGGVISARIDLQLGGKNFTRLFDHATGKLDVVLWPRDTNTKIIDVWANNLFLLILPEIKRKDSRLNCIVALMDLDDGVMKEDLFIMDTTKVWMNGNINVDFVEEHVRLSLYPRSKTARLFALQAPIRAQGNFNDIRLVTNPVDIAAAYVSFITSPLHVPARWVFGDKVPEDASEQCEIFFERENVIKLKEKMAAEEQKEIDELLNTD